MKLKYLLISCLLVAVSSGWLTVVKAAEAVVVNDKDAIAIRVMPNSEHLSPLGWYYKNIGTQGSPQSVIVDGYEAIRDNRTVYVSAGNVSADKKLFTNIYIISYTQDADSDTNNIFSQILKYWKFNSAIIDNEGTGVCYPVDGESCEKDGDCRKKDSVAVCSDKHCVRKCLLNSDCSEGKYCTSQKAKIIRDVKRMADLTSINTALKAYKTKNNSYPILNAGTYLPGKTISVWPSWTETFTSTVGYELPKDPVNKLGDCPDNFNEVTCWDEKNKTFATDFKNPILPEGSKAYVYMFDKAGNEYRVCANFETDYDNIPEAMRCDSFWEEPLTKEYPTVTIGGLSNEEGPFTAYIMADSKYPINWGRTEIKPVSPETWGAWVNEGWEWSYTTGLRMTNTFSANQKKLSAEDVSLAPGSGYKNFEFSVKIYDIKGNYGVANSIITICHPRDCSDVECGRIADNCGGTLICGTCDDSEECVGNRCIVQ